jgi:excisionase family DNA binding protein
MAATTNQETAETRLLTVPEAATRLGISPPSVWNRIARGELPVVQLGGRKTAVRILAKDLDAYVEAHRVTR